MKIAIDGPAGAGKSTVAKALAKKMKMNYLDTGAMYRAAALYMMGRGIDVADAQAVGGALPEMDMRIIYKDGAQRVLLDGKDVTDDLRTPEVTKGSSDIAVLPDVRVRLVELQRQVAEVYDIVMDGRDIGTYVLPGADFKFFITATPAERAKRRYLEIKDRQPDTSVEKIEREIIARDKTDMGRKFAPLRQAEDAIFVDTTDMDVGQVIALVEGKIKGAL